MADPAGSRDALILERGALQLEIQYRRDRRTGIFTWAQSVLGVYSSLWWDDQRRSGSALQRRQRVVDKELGFIIPRDGSHRSRMVGGLLSIILLTMVALLATRLPLSGTG